MTPALRAALEAVKDACPQHRNWFHDGCPVWTGTRDTVTFDEQGLRDAGPDAIAAAAHACMYWRRRFEATTDDQNLALNYWFKFSAWRQLLDLLDPPAQTEAGLLA
jgi:hypothetical protein